MAKKHIQISLLRNAIERIKVTTTEYETARCDHIDSILEIDRQIIDMKSIAANHEQDILALLGSNDDG